MNIRATDPGAKPEFWVLCAPAILVDLFGMPNEALSHLPDDIRFREDGSLRLNPENGRWQDDQLDLGGEAKDLIDVYMPDIDDPDEAAAYAEQCSDNLAWYIQCKNKKLNGGWHSEQAVPEAVQEQSQSDETGGQQETDATTYSHIWRSKDHDFPCTPTGVEWRNDADGRIYVRVKTPDGEHIVPKDELVQPPPEPDRSQLETFVPALFKYATAGNWVSLRAFFEGRDLRPCKITPVKLNGDFNVLIEQAFQDAKLAASYRKKVVFCPPIATFTNPKNAKEISLAEGLALSVECDAHAQAARIKLEELLGPTTVVVESGGQWINPETNEPEPKLHLHYRLNKPATSKDDQAKLKQARKLAAVFVGADTSNITIVHPIRWPGSLHRKNDPKLCRIVSLNDDAEIDLDAALKVLQEATGDGTPVPPLPKKPKDNPGKVAKAFEDINPDDKLGADIELPLLPFPPIKEACPWLKHVHDTGGADQSEVLWRDALRISMFLENGETLIHEFSKQHDDYDPETTKKKYDDAYKYKVEQNLGWPLCQTIREHKCTQCETCPHRDAGGVTVTPRPAGTTRASRRLQTIG
jgi:hypothetical protein